jgi:ABC-type uncharacterized transport system permease subunit
MPPVHRRNTAFNDLAGLEAIPTKQLMPLTQLESPWRQHRLQWGFIFLTTCWVLFTIIFAYDCTRTYPLTNVFFNPTPPQAILVLNVMAHVTVLGLQTITSATSEAVRWALASTVNGIPAFSFMILGRATGVVGVLELLRHKQEPRLGDRIVGGHMFWGIQRFEN